MSVICLPCEPDKLSRLPSRPGALPSPVVCVKTRKLTNPTYETNIVYHLLYMGQNASLSSHYQATQLFVLQNRASELSCITHRPSHFTQHATFHLYTLCIQCLYNIAIQQWRLVVVCQAELKGRSTSHVTKESDWLRDFIV